MADQIPRIEAHQQRMQLQVVTCATSPESVKQLDKAIQSQMGTVVRDPEVNPLNAKADPGAFDTLRRWGALGA